MAAFNVDGYTLHSLLHLPVRGEFKELQGTQLHNLQQAFASVQYLIIDEISLVGRKTIAMIDSRLRQAFPHKSTVTFGGCSAILVGDFGQLPPVMDLHAVAVIKDGLTVERVPRSMSHVCWFFLRRGNEMSCRITDHRKF